MTTQKEDAESIAGKEKAKELDELEKAALVGKSEAIVERAEEDEEEVEEEKVEGEITETAEEEPAEVEEVEPPAEEVAPEIVQEMSKKLDTIKELVDPTVEPHALDTVFENMRSEFDEVLDMDLSPDEKLQLLQPSFEALAGTLKSGVSGAPEVEPAQEVITKADVEKLMEKLITPLYDKVGLLVATLDGEASGEAVRTATSKQRSLTQAQILELSKNAPEDKKPGSIDAIALNSVQRGLPSY